MSMIYHRLDGPQDAPVVVLSTSIGTTHAMWHEQVPALAEHLRVLRYDHRGHGRSATPPGPYTMADLGGDVVDLLDRLSLDRVSFCGLSMGGMVGQWLGANAPERIDRLVLCATKAFEADPTKWHQRAATVRAEGVEAIADTVLAVWLTEAYRAAHPHVTARYREMMLDNATEGYAGCCEAIAGFDVREQLATIRAPTLVIAGAQDTAITPEQARELQEAIPDCELELVADAAHLPNLEQPEAFTSRVLDHLTHRPSPVGR